MKLKQIRVDGYKNLINCVINLGDFNVLVGPNNSGKSNFMEVFTILFGACLGDEGFRKAILKGFPTRRFGSSICHLKGYEAKPLAIGVTFETNVGTDIWVVDYDLVLRRTREEKDRARFLAETLQAKKRSRTGKPITYIARRDDRLKIRGRKERKIGNTNSSLLALESLYPEFAGLPAELKLFIINLSKISLTYVFAISPDGLRNSIGNNEEISGYRVSSFDLLLALDQIHKNKERFEIFKQSICDILDIDNFVFVGKNIPRPSEKGGKKGTSERVRYCFIRRKGDEYAHIDEYSDGTLAVTGIMAALFSERHGEPILCIEELENCLHPAAVEKLLRFLQDHSDRQPVLITTHSPYLLNGVKPEDVNVAVVDNTGAAHFEKVKKGRRLRDYLNKGLMSFGELLVNDFEGFREG